jgi:SNF2 domain-containing protein/helicase-like protein
MYGYEHWQEPGYHLRMLIPAENPPYNWPERVNRRAQACDRCGQMVDAEAGLLVRDAGAGNRWAVLHYSCAPPDIQQQAASQFADPNAPPTFTFDVKDGELWIQPPAKRLSENDYRASAEIARTCCRGEKVGYKWHNFAPLERAAEIQGMFEQGGFSVAVTDSLQAAMEAGAAAHEDGLAAVQARAANVDQILHDLGMETQGTPFSLYDFQRTGVQWLASRKRALLADDQGLGKTIQSSVAVPDNAPVVIVAPVSLLENWAREMARWRPERAAGVKILGSGKGEKATGSFKRWPLAGETFITTYSRLPTSLSKIGEPAPGTYMICDEAHNLKTLRIQQGKPKFPGSSKRAAYFYAMSQAILRRGGAVWLMTGTPLMNRPNELWSLLQQANLHNESFGTLWQLAEDFGVPRTGYNNSYEWNRSDPDPEIIGPKLQRVMLRREKQDVLKDLPPKRYQTVRVSIDPEAVARLAAMEAAVMRALEAEEARAGDIAGDIAQLKAAEVALQKAREGTKLSAEDKEILKGTKSSAPGFEEIAKARRILAQAKTPALLNLIRKYEEQGEPLIVFSAHLEPLNALAKLPGWAVITGAVKPSERQKIVDAFQRGELKGVGGQIRAAGVGLTLTRSANVLFLDKDWTPAGNVQAEDRAHRIGQQRPVNIVSLVADHAIDERVNGLLDHKASLIKNSISAGKRGANEEVIAPFDMTQQHEFGPAAPFDPVVAGFVPGPADPEAALAAEIVDQEREREEERRRRLIERRQPTSVQLAQTDRRGPVTPDEHWAAQAMHDLAAMDQDFAREENFMGFSQAHSTSGHRMSALLSMGRGLTEAEWKDALATARYHQSQVADRPSASDEELAALEKARQRALSRRRRLAKAAESDDSSELGDWVVLPDGREAVIVGRKKRVRGKPTVWILQARGGDKLEMTAEQIRGVTAGTMPAPAARPAPPPPPPPAPPPRGPDEWSGQASQQTLWNPPWQEPLQAWPSRPGW